MSDIAQTSGSRLSPGLDSESLDRVDRILLGACAAIWLLALGAGVAATVALVDLGRGHPQSSGEPSTPWLLYTVIGVSAAVIIAAVPLLLRARRTAMSASAPQERPRIETEPAAEGAQAAGVDAPTTKMRTVGSVAAPVDAGPGYAAARATLSPIPSPVAAAVDQLWLRCAAAIGCAMGVAMLAVGVATYLMAVESDTAAWVFYVLAGIVTLGMPAIPWFYLSQLRVVLESPAT